METKPLLWVSTVMAICMSSRRFMGREWLVRDDFGIKFLVTFPGLYTFHLHSSHYIGCSQHVWLSRCGMSKDAADQWVRVTEWLSSVAVRAPSMTLTKMVRQFVLGLAHTCRAHRAQAIHFIHTMPRMQSSLCSSGLWSLRCMLCIAMCNYVTESHFFSLLFSSNSVDSDNFVHFLVHSNRTHEFLADNLMVTKHCGGTDVWCRSYLAACLGPRPNQYNPRNHWYVYCIRIYYISLHIYMYIYAWYMHIVL